MAYSSNYGVAVYPDGSRSVYSNGVTYTYDSSGKMFQIRLFPYSYFHNLNFIIEGDLVSTSPGTGGLSFPGINAPAGSATSSSVEFQFAWGVGLPGLDGLPGLGARLQPNVAIPNNQWPNMQANSPNFPMPPNQVTIQVPEKRKVQKNQSQKENQNFVPNYSNPYAPFQYQTAGHSKTPPYTTLVSAAIAPSIVPFTYYPISAPAFNSIPTMMNKPSKKKSSDNHQNTQNSKKASKEPEKHAIPFISIAVSPHPKSQKINLQRGLISANNINPSKSMYSLNQMPPANQAAYFNYLNTYTPDQSNFNNQDNIPSQFPKPVEQFNQYTSPFTSPFSSQYPNGNPSGRPQQFHSELNLPMNGQNSFTNSNLNSPFSGFMPLAGNIPAHFYGNIQNAASNSKPSEYNDDSEESDEDTLIAREPRS